MLSGYFGKIKHVILQPQLAYAYHNVTTKYLMFEVKPPSSLDVVTLSENVEGHQCIENPFLHLPLYV